MGKGKSLDEGEQGQIQALSDENSSISYIAAKIRRSRDVVSRRLKEGSSYGKKPRSGRPRVISPRTAKAIIKFAEGKSVTANQIKAHFDLNVSKNTVLRVLKEQGGLKSRKLQRKPVLTDTHKADRIAFAKRYMDLGEKWKNVMFSDEKKFNLDGPDGYAYYWHGLSSSPAFLSHRAFGGGSIMVWACFDFFGRSKLVFIEGGINSEKYQSVLAEHLLPLISLRNHPDTLFQQDNARPHVSKSTNSWMDALGVQRMEWPAYSPDINPIENLWGILVQRVYANGMQFTNIDQLKEKLTLVWEELEAEIFERLTLSMKNRIFEVLINNGANTKY